MGERDIILIINARNCNTFRKLLIQAKQNTKSSSNSPINAVWLYNLLFCIS